MASSHRNRRWIFREFHRQFYSRKNKTRGRRFKNKDFNGKQRNNVTSNFHKKFK